MLYIFREEIVMNIFKKNTCYVIGSNDEWLTLVGELLSKKFKVINHGSSKWQEDIIEAQNMLIDGQVEYIFIVEPYCVTGYEQKLFISTKLDRIIELPYKFYKSREHTLSELLEMLDNARFLDGGRIGEIQFNLTDKCNLNCNLCSHFCPIVKEPEEYSVESFIKDAKQIKALTEHVDTIGLWGGEALLNNNLERIIMECRKIFNDSRIELGTNGLLVNKINASLLRTIKKTNCKVIISGYPPTLRIKEDIEDILNTFGIKYKISIVEKFFKRYDMSGLNDIEKTFSKCGSKVCHTVVNGKYSSCYFPIAAHIYNEYFNEEAFDYKDAVYDLYEKELKPEKFCTLLKSANSCCMYCSKPVLYDWSNNGSNCKQGDWIVE